MMSSTLVVGAAALDTIFTAWFAISMHKEGQPWRKAIPIAWIVATIAVAIGYAVKDTA
jgi:hypothetical protein